MKDILITKFQTKNKSENVAQMKFIGLKVNCFLAKVTKGLSRQNKRSVKWYWKCTVCLTQ